MLNLTRTGSKLKLFSFQNVLIFRAYAIKFEELLKNSEGSIKEICSFLEIDFQETMLKVPVVGSSTEKDNKGELKIDVLKINKWKNGGLSQAEIYLSQKISSAMLKEFDYPLKKFLLPPVFSVYYLIIFHFNINMTSFYQISYINYYENRLFKF